MHKHGVFPGISLEVHKHVLLLVVPREINMHAHLDMPVMSETLLESCILCHFSWFHLIEPLQFSAFMSWRS